MLVDAQFLAAGGPAVLAASGPVVLAAGGPVVLAAVRLLALPSAVLAAVVGRRRWWRFDRLLRNGTPLPR